MTRVLMLGWEYPPHITGGLAAATAGMVQGLLAQGIAVELLIPISAGVQPRSGLTVRGIVMEPLPEAYTRPGAGGFFGLHFFEAVDLYRSRAVAAARRSRFDLVHAHEWLTAAAASEIAQRSGRPWVWHVHATEYDRAGEHGNPRVVEAERRAVTAADLIISVSRYTREILIRRYGAHPARVHVVHNSVAVVEGAGGAGGAEEGEEPEDRRPLVLFLGRLTFQKGPDYFIEAAARVLSVRPDVLFVLAGEGDMRHGLMRRVAELGLGRSILFTGFVRPEETRRLFASADLYVMPSVSEPFGISALEAMVQGTPVIISRGAGVGELVRSVLEVDFWDTHQLAERILSVLAYPALRRELREKGRAELDRWTWEDAGARIAELYEVALLEHE
ncbi:MAG: glycosyltransferase family 4 protein [Gemmatimonadetes bacterium]|nr:glycosyltransferase family 4 protein [Gemmatimonadota bacterium]